MSNPESQFEVVEEPNTSPMTVDRQVTENQPDTEWEDSMLSDTGMSIDELSDPKVIDVHSASRAESTDSQLEEQRRRKLPNISEPGGWAADASDAEEKAAEKTARKEVRRAKRAKKLEAVAEAQARGDKPTQPCRQCQGDHWTDQCPAPGPSGGMLPPPVPTPTTPRRKRGRKRGRASVSVQSSPQQPHKRRTIAGSVSGSSEGSREPSSDPFISGPRTFPAKSPMSSLEARTALEIWQNTSDPVDVLGTPKSTTSKASSSLSSLPGGVELTSRPAPSAVAAAARQRAPRTGPPLAVARQREAPKRKTAPPPPVPTRRQERKGGPQPAEDSMYMDGKWLYITMPASLRGTAAPAAMEVIDALVDGHVLAGRAFSKCAPHDKKGWLVHCISREVVEVGANRSFPILGGVATTSVYHTSGPCVFVCHKSGPASSEERRTEVAAQVANIPQFEGYRFWFGYQEYKFVAGDKLLVIFENSPGVHRFDVPVGNINVGFKEPFKLRFVMADQGRKCDFCHLGHPTKQCPQARAVSLPQGHPCEDLLLAGRPSDAQT